MSNDANTPHRRPRPGEGTNCQLGPHHCEFPECSCPSSEIKAISVPLSEAINEPCKGCGKRPIDFMEGQKAAPQVPAGSGVLNQPAVAAPSSSNDKRGSLTPQQLIETVRGVLSAVRDGTGPVAVVVNNNQSGSQHIIETAPNVTLDVGTKLYSVPSSAITAPDTALTRLADDIERDGIKNFFSGMSMTDRKFYEDKIIYALRWQK